MLNSIDIDVNGGSFSGDSYEIQDVPATCGGAPEGRLVLLRHGQTIWSESGQHTGRTDIPLTQIGCSQAVYAGERIRQAFPKGFDADCQFVSPLVRARQTAQLAGFTHCTPLEYAAEWDYGCAEGRTRKDVSALSGVESWDVWRDGPKALPEFMSDSCEESLPSGETVKVVRCNGESLQDVSDRTQKIIDSVLPKLKSGKDVIIVAHAHVLRILAMRWLGVDASQARLLRLDTAHYSALGTYKGDRVIVRWNC
ncbi:histidine phosphatase family protein [Gardnerella vaginalis]|uniref:histidine phosphatase family protein n=1 Tax=Gardnerella vaginalis TaxID=2702 RepID=UPI0039707F64